MRRYKFLNKYGVYSSLNGLRASLLAAKDGNDVEEIMNAILTHDERLKIGRRIEIAQMLSNGIGHDEIIDELNVGRSNISQVSKKLGKYPRAFSLINKRMDKVEKTYKKRIYKSTGGSTRVFKKKKYTGFTRKDVIR